MFANNQSKPMEYRVAVFCLPSYRGFEFAYGEARELKTHSIFFFVQACGRDTMFKENCFIIFQYLTRRVRSTMCSPETPELRLEGGGSFQLGYGVLARNFKCIVTSCRRPHPTVP